MLTEGIVRRWAIARARAAAERPRNAFPIAFEPSTEKFRALQLIQEKPAWAGLNLASGDLLVTG